MTTEDLHQIEELLGRFANEIRSDLRVELRAQGARFDAKLDEQGARFEARLDEQGARFEARLDEQAARFDVKLGEQGHLFDTKLEQGLAAQSEDFERWFGIQREAFQHDLSLLGEGHQMLAEKIDRLAGVLQKRMDALEQSLDGHKADPHAHERWRVSEDEGG